MLNALDLWSSILYGAINISHYWHWNFCHFALYRVTRDNDPIQNNSNNDNNNSNNINDNDFNNNISKYYWKIIKINTVCFHNFGGAIDAQGVICYPRVTKGVITLQQIIIKLKQHIFQLQSSKLPKNTEKDIFCTCSFVRLCTVQVIICLLRVWTVVIKIHKIICKPK